MPLELTKKSGADATASNKPPQDHSPDLDLYAWNKEFPDGKRIWRSYPLPDRLALMGWLHMEHFQEKMTDTVSLSDNVHHLVKGLGGAEQEQTDKAPFAGKGSLLAKVKLKFGNRHSTVYIEISKVTQEGDVGFKMKLEFNPRKLKLDGCKQLQSTLYQAAMGAFHLDRFLADAWITRLDVAVDYVGVRPADLIVTLKAKKYQRGQRVHYLGADGALETVYVHRPKKTAGLGSLGAKLYDRNRAAKAQGKPPPYPGRQVARLEIVKKRGFPVMAELPHMKDPFADVRLSYAAPLAAPTQAKTWPRYLTARMGVGHAAAMKSIGVQPVFGSSLRARYDKHPSNLLDAGMWDDWHKGLYETGLLYFVVMAMDANHHGDE